MVNINESYTKYDLGEPIAYNTAYDTYRSQLVEFSADEPENIPIPSTFADNQETYYNARTAALNAISAAAKDLADSAVSTAKDAHEKANAANTAVKDAADKAEELTSRLRQCVPKKFSSNSFAILWCLAISIVLIIISSFGGSLIWIVVTVFACAGK